MTRPLLVTTLSVFVGGCVSVAPRASFEPVQRTVAERTGQRVYWDQGTDADAAVAKSVEAMLQRELTADAAVQVALLNNRRVQAAYEDLAVAQADLVAAGLLRNPVFDAQVRFSTAGGGTGVEMTLVQDFIDLLYIPLRKRTSAASLEAAKLRVAGEVIGLAGEARAAFCTFQASSQMLDVRRQIVQATEASYEVARRLREAGNTSELDLLNEQALYEQSKLELRAAEADVARDRERLNRLMGLWGPASASWTVAARLPDLPPDEPPAEGLERRAVEQSLELAAAHHRVEEAARALGLSTPQGLLPEAQLGASAERDVSGGWAVGPAFTLPIPLFNQGQPARAAAGAELRRTRQQYAALAVDVRSRTRAARDALAAAREQAEYYRTVVLPLRGRILEQTQLFYNAMQVGPTQLLAAKQQQIDAGAAYVRALRAYWLARTQLDQLLAGHMPASDIDTNSELSSSTPASGRGGK
jgi:cobalt-zinc-cadmium efflux system outer membrane protein